MQKLGNNHRPDEDDTTHDYYGEGYEGDSGPQRDLQVEFRSSICQLEDFEGTGQLLNYQDNLREYDSRVSVRLSVLEDLKPLTVSPNSQINLDS